MIDVPLVDLAAQHREIEEEVFSGLRALFASSAYILGPAVGEFEAEFAAFSKVRYCIGVASGTDALELALRSSGIGPGDEVIVPVNTFIATAQAVVRAGATPILVDCDEQYQLIDVSQAEKEITGNTRAIIPVHLFGQMAPMSRVIDLASRHNLLVIEDAAQSHGATQEGRVAGESSAAAGVSFYPGKNLGAYGDAGAVLTNSGQIAGRVRAMRNWGSDRKYHHPELGFNSRIDTLQAVILLAKLRRLRKWNDARREAAARYDTLLAEIDGVGRPNTLVGNEHVWHLYVVRVRNRDAVLESLHSNGIGAAVHYPIPIHLQKAFAYLGKKPGDFPVAEKAATEILSLPLFPHISEEQQDAVVAALGKALSN